jgi:hypothetical protein
VRQATSVHRVPVTVGVVLAAALALAAPLGALADEPSPDPTTAPAYTPTPGTVPAGAVPPAPTTSAKLAVLSGHRLTLDTRKLRTTLEVRCRSSIKGHCGATGQLFVTLHGHRTEIGAWAGQIPGQQIFAPRFKLTAAVRKLRTGHAIHGSLRLTNRVSSAQRATAIGQPITTVVTLPVTILPLPQTPPPGPTVTTGPDAGVTLPTLTGNGGPGSATVTGLVNTKNEHTTFHAEYGPAKGAYEASTAEKLVNSDDHFEHVVTATLTGLGSFPTVHYRLVATNDDGTVFGGDQSLSIPFVLPAPGGFPTLDTTAAGPVFLTVTSNICLPSLAVTLAGQDVTCTVSVFNPQPPVVGTGAGTTAVRPASEVLAIHAPTGMIGSTTHSLVEPLPLVVSPQNVMTGTVKFSVVQAPVFGTPELVQQGLGAPTPATMPTIGRPNLHTHISCAAVGRFVPTDEFDCTITVQNVGNDTADITSFELTGTAQVNHDGDFTSGDPPLVLPGILSGGDGSPVTIKTRMKTGTGSVPGAAVTLSVAIGGIDDTDRAPFSDTQTSNALTVVDKA